eukprot:1031712-Ditylum_brightwellii.AAC.1
MQGCAIKPVCGKINLENDIAEFNMNPWSSVCPTISMPWALHFHQYTTNKAIEVPHIKCVQHIWFWCGWCPHAYFLWESRINKIHFIP